MDILSHIKPEFIIFNLPILLGLYKIGIFLYQCIRSIFISLLPKNLLKKYGGSAKSTWAVVTGASNGIGEGFCEQLAKMGFNICLISRTKSKLENVEMNLHKLNPNIKTKVISVDFTNAYTLAFFDSIDQQLKDLDISVLVNNVGCLLRDDFESVAQKIIKDTITVNCIPMVILSKRIIPKMLTRGSKSAIINISSLMATMQFPRRSIYCATKAFNDLFSRSLTEEYKQKIDIISIRPLYVKSQITPEPGLTVINKNQCASGSLSRIGYDAENCGHLFHRIQFFIVFCIPLKIRHYFTKTAHRRVPVKQLVK